MKMPTKKPMSENSENSKMVDKEYVRMMKEHHDAAVIMSQDYLKEGKNEMIRGIAEKIIKDQSEQINTFKSWLEENK